MRVFRIRRIALTVAVCSFILIVSKFPYYSNGIGIGLLGLDFSPGSTFDCIYNPCSSVPVTYGTNDLGDYIISGTLHVTLRWVLIKRINLHSAPNEIYVLVTKFR